MTIKDRVKSVFGILEAMDMPKGLRYRLKEAARDAMEAGANFGGVVVTSRIGRAGNGKSIGVLHVWRVSETGEIIPLTIEVTQREGAEAV
jgi:hypothetical protein